MSISPEGRTRGIFPGLNIPNESIVILPRQQELTISQRGSRRFSWGKTALFAVKWGPAATLVTGFITDNPVMWVSSAIVLAAEGAGIYLHNMSKFLQSPPQKT